MTSNGDSPVADNHHMSHEQADIEIESLVDDILELLNKKIIARELHAADSVYIAGSALAKCMALVIFDQMPRAAFDKADRLINSSFRLFEDYARAIIAAREAEEPVPEAGPESSPWDMTREEQ